MPQTEGTHISGIAIPGVPVSIIVGLLAGWIIGKWTEYSTSDEYAPTKKLAEQAETGPATIIIGGIADGMLSVWFPVIVVCAGTLSGVRICQRLAIQRRQLLLAGPLRRRHRRRGMLSTLGITLATDAYGPIADNAGGNAEMAGLEPVVRERTDALDSLGNTTAATGKGFAIGSAALTALAFSPPTWKKSALASNAGARIVAVSMVEDGNYKALQRIRGLQATATMLDMFLAMPSDLRRPSRDSGLE